MKYYVRESNIWGNIDFDKNVTSSKLFRIYKNVMNIFEIIEKKEKKKSAQKGNSWQ